MFKCISRRVSAVLMASAIVLAQVVMPVRQAFADTTPGALAASNQPCSSDLRTVYSDTNYQPDAAYVTNATSSYSNKDFTDSTTGIAWRQHNTALTITNTSPYVLTDLQAAVYADAGRVSKEKLELSSSLLEQRRRCIYI